ncbi:CLUMA_CG011652, isoform A [Clunio marinus]|uniref:CLUMA_CG011652, isoform A n=1 Tax=Clunio marinus TaxID=568069 RepID=A0A1J1IEV1_9DIPT|nr:CLUMA_CG011652, isoform A [Clunio marinus]
MYSDIFGYRINLIFVAISVAVYDLVHIAFAFLERFQRFQSFENADMGCLNDLFQYHCVAIYTDLGFYTLDFVFTLLLIYGVKSFKSVPILAWLLLSGFHLIDFLLWFTPFLGPPVSVSDIDLLMWADIGVSTAGFIFVIYFYKKLLQIEQGSIEREQLTNVEDLRITGVDLEAY